tara:strand:- start:121 stop:531 length:411 start_codon:yes stop_codon:yes gene_type:complete
MATNGRNKGAAFERDIAKMLDDELGIQFKRDLEQYREGGHGDLIPSDPAFAFTLELKRYADGPIGGQKAWWAQTCVAARREGKIPALIYRYDRKPIRCVVPMNCVWVRCAVPIHWHDGHVVEMDFEAFCYLVREIM